MLLPEDKLKSLIEGSGLITKEALAELDLLVVTSGKPLWDVIVEKKLATDEQIGQLVAKQYQLPYVSLEGVTIPDEVFNLIPERIAGKQKVVVFERTPQAIKVATSQPENTDITKLLAQKTGTAVQIHYTTDSSINKLLRAYKKDLQKSVDNLLKEGIWDSVSAATDDPPVARIVNLLIETAYQERSSDIHIEPYESDALARFRIDGILHDVLRVPKYLHERIITRIKVLSNLRTDEHLSAQDGKMKIPLEAENLDVRVSILPIVDGEKAVLRLLASRLSSYSFGNLGMNEVDLAKVTNAFNQSYGMILSTGPTGSGKTTSIYSILKILNTRERNITTIEDPVEYRIQGANQIHVNPKTNLTFAHGLRAILRQDPNVIFVGEIRDSETAGIAVNAALTGHLVVSTLHTNDASTAIPRLIDMNVEPYLVASTVNIIVAQRLVRQICGDCKEKSTVEKDKLLKNFPESIIKKILGSEKSLSSYHGKGCSQCRNTGYVGRIGIFEVLAISTGIRKLIIDKADADVIATAASREGMKTMLEDGLEKVSSGMTTLEEILRVTKSESV